LQIWLVIPDPPLATGASGSGSATSASGSVNGASTLVSTSSKGKAPAPRFGKAKVEFLATLDQHTLNVNTVRFSPSGACLLAGLLGFGIACLIVQCGSSS
jgi:hypothetical protein